MDAFSVHPNLTIALEALNFEMLGIADQNPPFVDGVLDRKFSKKLERTIAAISTPGFASSV